MRKVYRNKDNKLYWTDRWQNSGTDRIDFHSDKIYPMKYTDIAITESSQKILEAGCGAGRLYFYYKNKGKDIEGIDFIENAVKNIKDVSPEASVRHGDICAMPYFSDETFDTVLAMGLFHNIEDESALMQAFRETGRVLRLGGVLCCSVRFDSFENNLIEKIVASRSDSDQNEFHRWHFSLADMDNFLTKNGMFIRDVKYVRNVSFLFKFNIFRSRNMQSDKFDESEARSKGFKLNLLGRIIDSLLHRVFPKQFSNLLVIYAEKG